MGANEYRGDKGNLSVTRGKSDNQLYDAFLESCRQVGYPVSEDFNGSQQEGCGRFDFTIANGRRCRLTLHIPRF